MLERKEGSSERLPLSLFVAWIAANNEHHPAAADDFALITDSLNAGSNFHGKSQKLRVLGMIRNTQVYDVPTRLFKAYTAKNMAFAQHPVILSLSQLPRPAYRAAPLRPESEDRSTSKARPR